MRKLVMILLTAFWLTPCFAEEIDMQALVRETQITRQSTGKLDMVWWIPNEYWQESFRRSGTMAPKQADEMLAVLDDYILVAVLEGNIGALGVMSSTAKEDIEKKTKLTFGKDTLAPIPESELSPGARALIQMIKPVIANLIGQMGQGLHFVAFKGNDEKGASLVDARKLGQLSVTVGANKFDYRLPLGSLLPAKIDKASGERFPGNYEFSPYTGKKLTTE